MWEQKVRLEGLSISPSYITADPAYREQRDWSHLGLQTVPTSMGRGGVWPPLLHTGLKSRLVEGLCLPEYTLRWCISTLGCTQSRVLFIMKSVMTRCTKQPNQCKQLNKNVTAFGVWCVVVLFIDFFFFVCHWKQ